jgi:hypothetical protein
MHGIVGVVLLCLLGAGQAETPKVTTMTTLMEERNSVVGKPDSARVFDRLYASFRIEGAKTVRSYGNLNVTEAKTDTGADLIRHRKDKKAIFGITNVPGFLAIRDYQAKTGMIDVQIELFTAPRTAKTFKLKGTIDVLVGGEPTDIDIPNIVTKEEKEVLEHKAFSAAGLKIIMARWPFGNNENRVAYTIEGNNSIVKEITVVDASGKVIPASHSSAGSRTSGQTHFVTSSRKLPRDAKLRVTIYKGAKTLKLPFEFDNIELP